MRSPSDLARIVQAEHVPAAGGGPAEIAAQARAQLARRRACLVRGFPGDPGRYLEFLSCFGTPLSNYSSLSKLAGHDPSPQINRVRYQRKDPDGAYSVHYVAAGLRPHSARSWYARRPAYFAMLMIDPGWRDAAAGQRGESVLLSWQQLFTELARRDGAAFERHFEVLAGTPVTFTATNVREELSSSPLIYPIADADDRYDMGVRLKQDMNEKVRDLAGQIPDFPRYRDALAYLMDASADEAAQAVFPMEAGDLLLLDNNRFAHGRRAIVGERTGASGTVQANSRELWSVAIAAAT
jgi:hypothetical protein